MERRMVPFYPLSILTTRRGDLGTSPSSPASTTLVNAMLWSLGSTQAGTGGALIVGPACGTGPDLRQPDRHL